VAIDTVKLRSPHISHLAAKAIEEMLNTRTARENSSGKILYEIINGQLIATHDSRVAVQVMRTELVDCKKHFGFVGPPVEIASKPYIFVEGSVHKAMLGHNVWGGPTDILGALRWFIWDVSERLGVDLPLADEWLVHRIDWAEIFNLSLYGVQTYISSLSTAAYRNEGRTVMSYGSESLMAAGRTTAIKFYSKGLEFAKHDAKKLRRLIPQEEVAELQVRANPLLRVEVGIKKPKLEYDFGFAPTVANITQEYVCGVYDVEVGRIVKGGNRSMETVREHDAVQRRLQEVYGEKPRLAHALYGTWCLLAVHGEIRARRELSRAMFYRHLSQLRAAGVAWHGSDLVLKELDGSVPVNFWPNTLDSRCLSDVDPHVHTLCEVGHMYAGSVAAF